MWVPFLVLGTLNNAVPYWLLAFAETRIDSGLAAVIQAAAPILTVVLATRIDPSQRVRGVRLVGVGLGFVGVALLVGVQKGGQLVGALAVLGTATLLRALRPVRGAGGPLFAPLEATIGQLARRHAARGPGRRSPSCRPKRRRRRRSRRSSPSVRSAPALAYLLDFCFTLIARAGASRAILVTYLVPAFALLYGTVILDEPVTASALAGLVLILGGTALGTGAQLRRG